SSRYEELIDLCKQQQDDEQEGPLHIPTQEKRNELLNDHTPEEFLEVYPRRNVNNSMIRKEFEDIFVVSKGTAESMDYLQVYVYDVEVVYQAISQLLLYLYTLACLQYTVKRQWDLLYHHRLLKDEQITADKYPEVTNMVLANHTWYGLIETADKIWLGILSNEPSNFAVMLKCMFVFQQLREEFCIDKFGRCQKQ
ncbi:17531_t:CDS:2, partial [Funneliformis caledonium]